MKNRLICAFCLGVIFSGAAFAYNRESLRASVPSIYRETNKKFFNSELPPVPIAITDLSGEDTETETILAMTRFDGSFTMDIDLNRIHSQAQLRESIEHESCHIFGGPEEKEHGSNFRSCLKRFDSQE